MRLGDRLVEHPQVHGHEPEALALEPVHDLADETPLDRVRLAQDQGTFDGHR
jgi:hypothetical protein